MRTRVYFWPQDGSLRAYKGWRRTCCMRQTNPQTGEVRAKSTSWGENILQLNPAETTYYEMRWDDYPDAYTKRLISREELINLLPAQEESSATSTD